jgi:hypothetical protein
MARAPSPKCAGGFGAVSAAYDAPAQSRGQRTRFALWLLLLVPSAFLAVYRAAGRGLADFGEAFYFGCRSIGTTACAMGRWLMRLIAGSIGWAAAPLLTLALWVAAGLWLALSSLGAGTGRAAVSAYGASSRGISWLGPRSRSLSHWLARVSSSGVSLLAGLTANLGGWLIGTIEEQIKAFAATKAGRRTASSGKAGAKSRPAALASGGVRPPAHRA